MLGAICGDVIGSVYEGINVKHTGFPLFREDCRYTDDTTLTIAVADAIMNGKGYADTIREYGRAHPLAGYGSSFMAWLDDPNAGPYDSWGNGSAMRVSPVAWLFDTLEEVLIEAENTASVTHNHPEGIKGAQAIASAIKKSGTFAEHIWSFEKVDKMKPRIKNQMKVTYRDIKQIDKKTDEVIKVFEGALRIEEELNLKKGARNKIYECLSKKRKTAYGYKWKI